MTYSRKEKLGKYVDSVLAYFALGAVGCLMISLAKDDTA
jgi:hypothetical protein